MTDKHIRDRELGPGWQRVSNVLGSALAAGLLMAIAHWFLAVSWDTVVILGAIVFYVTRIQDWLRGSP